ncbi:MAG: hypothetical protein RSB70_03545 [Clostridium sp.]
MGSYGSHYEDYYNNISKSKNPKIKNRGIKNSESQKDMPLIRLGNKDYSMKQGSKKGHKKDVVTIFIRQLTGVLILGAFLLGCRVIDTNCTKKLYSISCSALSKEYDISNIIKGIKTGEYHGIENKILAYIDVVKTKLFGGKTIKERLSEEFKFPNSISLGNKKNVLYNNYEYIDKLSKVSFVQAASRGTVVRCSNEGEKYVLIDHGQGLQTKYTGLWQCFVSQGEIIDSDVNIGSIQFGNGEYDKYNFELLYMGKTMEFDEYIKR